MKTQVAKYFHVKNSHQVVAYAVDCTLATVAVMAGDKNRSVDKYDRQKIIAQNICDWMKEFDIDAMDTRAKHIIGKTTVDEWAKLYEV